MYEKYAHHIFIIFSFVQYHNKLLVNNILLDTGEYVLTDN